MAITKTIFDVVKDDVKPYIDLNAGNIAAVETTSTAAAAHLAGTQIVFKGKLYDVIQDIAQGGTIIVGTNIIAANPLSSQIGTLTNEVSDEVETRAKLGAHNLFDFDLTAAKAGNTSGSWSGNAYTYNGVTYTPTFDNKGNLLYINANGTATGTSVLYLLGTELTSTVNNYKNDSFVLNGCPSDGSSDSYIIRVQAFSSTATSPELSHSDDIGNGASIPLSDYIRLYLRVASGTTVSNIKFYPMIRLATDTDPTYQPYAMTNKELTDNKAEKSDLTSVSVTGTTNTSGSTITKGKYFYLNGTLCKALSDIASNATFTKNTNYEEVTAGALNALAIISSTYQNVRLMHNIPRLVPKDITSYVSDGSIWKRLNGTDGYELFEDIYVGDYWQMTEAISAYEQTQSYQATGSKYVTIAGIDMHYGDGDSSPITYHHLDMVAGQGFDGTQHFGRSRMNSSNTTVGGYVGSEMFTTTIGAVTSTGKRASADATATINEQLYAEFGAHLKTHSCLLSNAIDSARYNRYGQANGASSGWAWTSVQAVLMTEIECYGSIVWSSSGYDTGNGNKQLPLFAHSKKAMNNRSAYYWLRDVASSADFCNCSNNGYAHCRGASVANVCVRPRFILA